MRLLLLTDTEKITPNGDIEGGNCIDLIEFILNSNQYLENITPLMQMVKIVIENWDKTQNKIQKLELDIEKLELEIYKIGKGKK